jgi:hypothetical protein
MNTEIEALQNAATQLNLVIYEKHTQDKRKKVKMYFANMGNETVSPTLPYSELNMFLLGWSKSKNLLNTRK